MYVYRDTADQPDHAGTGSAGRDAAYWYDLSGDESAPVIEEARGPFEPLVSSNGPPAAGEDQAGEDQAGEERADEERADEEQAAPEGPAYAQASKLEQIKDFYLTAEAIGEDNVGKHFDQLLAQQRELISEYFKQGSGRGAEPDDQGGPGPDDGRTESPRSARVIAEQPRVW